MRSGFPLLLTKRACFEFSCRSVQYFLVFHLILAKLVCQAAGLHHAVNAGQAPPVQQESQGVPGPAAVAQATPVLAGNFRPLQAIPFPAGRSSPFSTVASQPGILSPSNPSAGAIDAKQIQRAETKSFGPSDFLNVNCERQALAATERQAAGRKPRIPPFSITSPALTRVVPQ
jgi:hypothetical protein